MPNNKIYILEVQEIDKSNDNTIPKDELKNIENGQQPTEDDRKVKGSKILVWLSRRVLGLPSFLVYPHL